MLLSVPYALERRWTYILNVFLYSAVFLGYAVCRVMKYCAMTKKNTARLAAGQRRAAAAACVLALCLTIGVYAYGFDAETDVERKGSSSVVEGDKSAAIPQIQGGVKKPADASLEISGQAEPAEGSASSGQEGMESARPELGYEPVHIYRSGSFFGTGEGYVGPITVSVTVQNDAIPSVIVVSNTDDEPYFSNAKTGVIDAVLATQSIDVDTVSGATFSSRGIIDGVRAALESAKNEPNT